MDPLQPRQSLPVRGHVRNKSSIKTSRPRSSTKGPLDADESPLVAPVAALHSQTAAAISAAAASSPHKSPPPPPPPPQSPPTTMDSRVRSPSSHRPMSLQPARASHRTSLSPARPSGPTTPTDPSRPKDFSFLLKPEIYHPLSPATVAPPFRNSPQQPAPDTSLEDLLTAGQFRAAAIVAAQQLTGSDAATSPDGSVVPVDPTDHARIFSLLYTRLTCLVLIDATSLAAQEGKALEDLNSSFYLDAATGAHLVPWELRVLNVRLQALGFGDPRRAVMSYYDLAREARTMAAQAMGRHDNSASELWKGRLAELGLRVAGALIEMDDLAGAAAHLVSMAGQGIATSTSGNHRLEVARALLWLHLGDTDAARTSIKRVTATVSPDDDLSPRIIAALCDMADDDYPNALSTWQELREDAPGNEMIAVNLAVCLLYVGRMQEGRAVLESLADAGYSSHALLFNLSTMYELCTDRSKALKLQLAQRMADRKPTADGWEKANIDFKL